MRRVLSFAFLALVPAAARADGPAPAAPGAAGERASPKAAPRAATNAEAAAAIAKFKAAFATRDLNDRLDAIDALAQVQHPDVVDELARLASSKNLDVKCAATQDLGWQRAHPALAGRRLAATIDANWKDWTHLADVIEAMRALEWRGSLPHLLRFMKHDRPAIVRWSLDAIGDLKDVRALDAVLALMRDLKVDEGVRWEGGSVTVDTGAAGSADQEAARAAYDAKYGRAAAQGQATARKMRSLSEVLFLVLKDLTGESFATRKTAEAWVEANRAKIDARKKALDEEQKAQDAAAQAALAAAKAK